MGRNNCRADNAEEKWQPNVNLDHLPEHDQSKVQQILYEESDIFAHNDGDTELIS